MAICFLLAAILAILFGQAQNALVRAVLEEEEGVHGQGTETEPEPELAREDKSGSYALAVE